MLPLVYLACALTTWADPPAPPPLAPRDVVTALETTLGDAIALAEPAVVAIAREKSETDDTTAIRGKNPQPGNRDPRLIPRGLVNAGAAWVSFDYGSGVVIGAKGEVLTAYHVVKGAKRLEVWAVDQQGFEAEVIAADPRSDLAVIVPRELPGVAPPKLRPLPVGDATTLRKGSFLVALGNPFNAARDGRPSASWGILSNVARRLVPTSEEQDRHSIQLRHYPTLLQLDAKLNLGMGGGAVVNLKGELVGVTTAAASAAGFDAQAGYAIPMDALGRRAVEALKQGKEVEYGFLGISLDDEQGTNRVKSAQPGTPAAEGGVMTDDLILAVDDVPVRDADGLLLAINRLPAGAAVRLKLDRQGEVLTRTVELAKFPAPGPVIATNRPAPWRGLRVDYTSRMPNAPFGPELLATMALGGVAVVDVVADSPAEHAGLRSGVVITHVGDDKIKNPAEFARAVAKARGPVVLQTNQGPVTIK